MREAIHKMIEAETEAKALVASAETEAQRLMAEARRQTQDLLEVARQKAKTEGGRISEVAVQEALRQKKETLAKAETDILKEVSLDPATSRAAADALVRSVIGKA
jgi:vacuolar-type H+-ATPase subunit H